MRKTFILLVALLMLAALMLTAGCDQAGVSNANTNAANKPPTNANTSATPPTTEAIKICTELRTEKDRHVLDLEKSINRTDIERSPEAAAPHTNRWQARQGAPLILTVKFLNGTDFQRDKVKKYVTGWTDASAVSGTRHKINFVFVPFTQTPGTEYSDIRILFGNGGSSSLVGRDNLNEAQNRPTMHYGWVNEFESENSIKGVILHEFGHAIGLIHEHQAPGANIPWDKPAVYKYYADTQTPPWDIPKVDRNIFYHYSVDSVNATAYDQMSIMHYYVPDSLTIGTFSLPENLVLSPLDISFIKGQYQFNGTLESKCFNTQGSELACP